MKPIDMYIYQNYFEPLYKKKQERLSRNRELLQKELARKKALSEDNLEENP